LRKTQTFRPCWKEKKLLLRQEEPERRADSSAEGGGNRSDLRSVIKTFGHPFIGGKALAKGGKTKGPRQQERRGNVCVERGIEAATETFVGIPGEGGEARKMSRGQRSRGKEGRWLPLF